MPPRKPTEPPEPPEPPEPYDPEALFLPNGPIDPRCVQDAIQTIMHGVRGDPGEPQSWTGRRMFCALRALAALHPRDPIELMLGVQVLNAYHAANACWRQAANPREQDDAGRHIAKAATTARTFDTLLRAMERRQAKPLSVPAGRPASQEWASQESTFSFDDVKRRADMGEDQPLQDDLESTDHMTDDEMVCAWVRAGRHRLADENEGLDIANTEGILPNGGMIVTVEPTKQQIAYMDRRLMLKFCRQKEADRRNGIDRKIVFPPLRTGEIVL